VTRLTLRGGPVADFIVCYRLRPPTQEFGAHYNRRRYYESIGLAQVPKLISEQLATSKQSYIGPRAVSQLWY